MAAAITRAQSVLSGIFPHQDTRPQYLSMWVLAGGSMRAAFTWMARFKSFRQPGWKPALVSFCSNCFQLNFLCVTEVSL